MADDEKPKIDGFDEVSIGYNYIKLSLAPLALSAGLSAGLSINAGFTFTVKLSGDYTTTFGPAIASTIWLGGIATFEYSAAGSTTVKVDGNPITVKTAVAENGGTAAKLHSAGARLLAGAVNQGSRLARLCARATRVQATGNSNSVGGTVSTGGSGN